MNVLIVEDNDDKCRQLVEFIRSEFVDISLQETFSYNSGLHAIRDTSPDVVILDMSMSTFDRHAGQSGGRKRPFAGRDIFQEIKRLELGTLAIVVTQYSTFGDKGNRRSLAELTAELDSDFPTHHVGTVYYHPSRSDWRVALARLLRRVGATPQNPKRKEKS